MKKYLTAALVSLTASSGVLAAAFLVQAQQPAAPMVSEAEAAAEPKTACAGTQMQGHTIAMAEEANATDCMYVGCGGIF